MNNKPLNILYVGSLWEGSTALHRMKAIQELGHNVQPVDTDPDYVRDKKMQVSNPN